MRCLNVRQAFLKHSNCDSSLTLFTEAADLAIDVAVPKDQPVLPAAYYGEQPPAPKLYSEGVVATDITEQFTNAASRAFTPQALLLVYLLMQVSRTVCWTACKR